MPFRTAPKPKVVVPYHGGGATHADMPYRPGGFVNPLHMKPAGQVCYQVVQGFVEGGIQLDADYWCKPAECTQEQWVAIVSCFGKWVLWVHEDAWEETVETPLEDGGVETAVVLHDAVNEFAEPEPACAILEGTNFLGFVWDGEAFLVGEEGPHRYIPEEKASDEESAAEGADDDAQVAPTAVEDGASAADDAGTVDGTKVDAAIDEESEGHAGPVTSVQKLFRQCFCFDGELLFASKYVKLSVIVPVHTHRIAPHVFEGNTAITEVLFSDNALQSIGEAAFAGCTKLAAVKLPEGVVLEGRVFEGCSKLSRLVLPESAVYADSDIAGTAYLLQKDQPRSAATKRSKRIEIARGAFENDLSLEEHEVADGTIAVGTRAFSGCRNLKRVTLPDSVVELGFSAFEGSGLREITLPSGLKGVPSSAFRDCAELERVMLPAGIESIGTQAFWGCSKLQEIEIPQGVANIHFRAFAGCTALRRVVVPEGVTEIGERAFEGCTELEEVVLPASLQTIWGRAFANCPNLQPVTIPEGCKQKSSLVRTAVQDGGEDPSPFAGSPQAVTAE